MSSAEERFGRALAELWVRDGIVVDDPRGLAAAVSAAFASGQGAKPAAALMERAGVRSQWNRTLREDRARALAARIHPLIIGPMLDVLSGDGSICGALSTLGAGPLSATERRDDYRHYGDSRLPPDVRFTPFSDDLDLASFGARTALVSTVLHHEEEPGRLLDALARSGTTRWIVVENCVTPDCTRAFHELADRFFNTCLNDIGVHCGDAHRTLEEWATLLERYGRVTVVADYFAVPGIPFPYSLLTVDLD